MQPLDRSDLLSLEDYATQREDFRAKVMTHKKHRRVGLGPHLGLYFEDRLTIQYQVQEMLRIERIFEADGIREELDAYNPLIPDGRNWKATAMIEYGDPEVRRRELARLVGIEHDIWVKVDGHERVNAIANEDLERSTPDKTSAVHFLRFELDDAMVASLRDGAALRMGVDHENYAHEVTVTGPVRDSLLTDLD
ncbi:MAG: DUF3501 family protein [Xanthomonadales bacterium]|nr:DUF3501 family protein [Xanthomonadales bacterium]